MRFWGKGSGGNSWVARKESPLAGAELKEEGFFFFDKKKDMLLDKMLIRLTCADSQMARSRVPPICKSITEAQETCTVKMRCW